MRQKCVTLILNWNVTCKNENWRDDFVIILSLTLPFTITSFFAWHYVKKEICTSALKKVNFIHFSVKLEPDISNFNHDQIKVVNKKLRIAYLTITGNLLLRSVWNGFASLVTLYVEQKKIGFSMKCNHNFLCKIAWHMSETIIWLFKFLPLLIFH